MPTRPAAFARIAGTRPADAARRILHATLVCVALAAAGAQAQTVRCEGADGKVTYSNTPCPTGTQAVRALPDVAAPPADDARAARERARADQKRVDQLQRQRQEEDARAARKREAAAKQEATRERDCTRLAARADQAQRELDRASLKNRAAAEKRLADARAKLGSDCVRR